MRTFLLFFISMCFATAAFAQGFKVSGRVVDADNNGDVLPLANVAMIQGEKLVAGVTTNAKGDFVITCNDAGKYLLRVSFVGYETVEKEIELSKKQKTVSLGTIEMHEGGEMLSEVNVTALAQELTIVADTFIYNAGAFRLPPGSSISSLLKELPGLEMNSEGVLTFQGKKVSEILVNGKPFIGDAKSVMANMTGDAIDKVKVYEKTDEKSEFTGIKDLDKQHVIDLKIKKEYMSSWNVNAGVGGGTDERFLGQVFASNFSDKYRAALYAQANNISQDQSVDENGEWSYNEWGAFSGLYTYRKLGAAISWDNGLKNSDAGFVRTNFDGSISHNNNNDRYTNNSELFVDENSSHFGYTKSNNIGRDISMNGALSLVWNIDTLNRIDAKMQFDYNKNNGKNHSHSSSYSSEYFGDDASMGLIGDSIIEEVMRMGINSSFGNSQHRTKSNNIDFNFNSTHRLGSKGGVIELFAGLHWHNNNRYVDDLSNDRYFKPEAPQSDVINRKYNDQPGGASNYGTSIKYSYASWEHFVLSSSYNFKHFENDNENNLYRLNRYDNYNSMQLPLGVRPSTLDSLMAVRDIENSFYSRTIDNEHALSLSLEAVWKKFEMTAALNYQYRREHLAYNRNNVKYSPSRTLCELRPSVALKWKFIENGEFSLHYRRYKDARSLLSLLPITDTSSEMIEIVSNPDLKDTYTNSFSLSGNYFNQKRGDYYYLRLDVSARENSVATLQKVDAMTGKIHQTERNVNGNYNSFLLLGMEQPLDSARHWTLSLQTITSYFHNNGYFNVGEQPVLSAINTVSPYIDATLRWRNDIWKLSCGVSYVGNFSKYDINSTLDRNEHFLELNISPMVDLPFGLKINTTLGYFLRSGYSDDMMNDTQWVWNASISQSFLKDRSLTLQLEAVDILQQRSTKYSYANENGRYFNSIDAVPSYVMLNVKYRFNIGGKR